MKDKISIAIVGFIIFSICIITGIRLRDYFYKQNLRFNLQNIQIGMTEKEVIQILGKPNHIWASDEPSKYWCYDTDSISHFLEEQPDIECGNMALQMSYMKNSIRLEQGQVIKIYAF